MAKHATVTVHAVNTYTVHRKPVASLLVPVGSKCTDGTTLGTLEVKGNGQADASNAQIQVGETCRVREVADRAQQLGLNLRPVTDMEFKIKQKGQTVAFSAVNHYAPPNTSPGIPLTPLIPLSPPLNPVVPERLNPPADNANVVAQIVRGTQRLAKTGVSNLIVPMAGIALVLVVGGMALVFVWYIRG